MKRKNTLAHQQGRNPLAGANYTNYANFHAVPRFRPEALGKGHWCPAKNTKDAKTREKRQTVSRFSVLFAVK
jgi:hypothetical protein